MGIRFANQFTKKKLKKLTNKKILNSYAMLKMEIKRMMSYHFVPILLEVIRKLDKYQLLTGL